MARDRGMRPTAWWLPGGGLGHLTRARAAAHTLGQRGPSVLWTASSFARDRRVVGDAEVEPVPAPARRDRDGLRRWLADALARRRPAVVVVDAFPGGVLGEWCGVAPPPGTRLIHLARRLRWDRYRPRLDGPLPAFDRVFAVEPLEPAHEAALGGPGAVTPLRLRDPAAPEPTLDPPLPPRTWLVVHAGPPDEVALLVGYARDVARAEGVDPTLVLVAPGDPPPVPVDRHVDLYPAAALFPRADRIFTAGGFNAVRQAAPFAARHHCLPLPRALDDQFWRAARARRAPCTYYGSEAR